MFFIYLPLLKKYFWRRKNLTSGVILWWLRGIQTILYTGTNTCSGPISITCSTILLQLWLYCWYCWNHNDVTNQYSSSAEFLKEVLFCSAVALCVKFFVAVRAIKCSFMVLVWWSEDLSTLISRSPRPVLSSAVLIQSRMKGRNAENRTKLPNV